MNESGVSREQSQSGEEKTVPRFLVHDVLPSEFSGKLSGEWAVSSGVDKGGQIARIVAKADDYLSGIVPAGADKKRLRTEAGRLLSYVQQSVDDAEFWVGVPEQQKAHLQSEIIRLWNEGGNASNEEWKETEKVGLVQPRVSAEAIPKNSHEYLMESVHAIPRIVSDTITLLNARVEMLKAQPEFRGSSSEEAFLILGRMLERILLKASALEQTVTVTEDSPEGIQKALKNYTALVKLLFPILDGLRDGYRQREGQAGEKTVANAFDTLHNELEEKLVRLGGIARLTVISGQKVNYSTMTPAEAVGSDDAKYGGRYSGSETVADVERNGYEFDARIEPDPHRRIIRPTQIVAFK